VSLSFQDATNIPGTAAHCKWDHNNCWSCMHTPQYYLLYYLIHCTCRTDFTMTSLRQRLIHTGSHEARSHTHGICCQLSSMNCHFLATYSNIQQHRLSKATSQQAKHPYLPLIVYYSMTSNQQQHACMPALSRMHDEPSILSGGAQCPLKHHHRAALNPACSMVLLLSTAGGRIHTHI
jgi:hypothetical protein